MKYLFQRPSEYERSGFFNDIHLFYWSVYEFGPSSFINLADIWIVNIFFDYPQTILKLCEVA